jgi:hypothetical protein
MAWGTSSSVVQLIRHRRDSTPAKRRNGTREVSNGDLRTSARAQEVSMNSQRSIDSELRDEESSETLEDESSFDEPGGETTR